MKITKIIGSKLAKAMALTSIAMVVSCGETVKDDTPWVELFDGKTLNGWNQKGGEAHYEVRDGMIVGSTVHDTPNSFMPLIKCTAILFLNLNTRLIRP